MALLLLKMNNLNAAYAVLSKANRFNNGNNNNNNKSVTSVHNTNNNNNPHTNIEVNLNLEVSVNFKSAEHAIEMAVKNDRTLLVFQESKENRLKISRFGKWDENTGKHARRHEDAGLMDAKFCFFFISGLYE